MKNGTKFGNVKQGGREASYGDFVMKARENAEIRAGIGSSGINRTGGMGRLIGLGEDQARGYGSMIHTVRENARRNYEGRISNGAAGKTAGGVKMGIEGGVSVEHTRSNNPVKTQTKFSEKPNSSAAAIQSRNGKHRTRKASFAPA